MGRPEGSMNRRTKLSGGRLLDVARTYTQEALRSIVRIARGEIQGSDGYPVLHPRGNHGKRRLPKDTSRMNAFEREVEERVQSRQAAVHPVQSPAGGLDRGAEQRPWQAIQVEHDQLKFCGLHDGRSADLAP